MTERYIVPSDGPNIQALQVTLSAAIVLAEKHECEITLCVPTLKHASTTILDQIFEPASIKKLTRGEVIKLNGHKIRMKSAQNIEPFLELGVIVGVWATPKMVKALDEASRSKAIVVLPWLEKEHEKWVKKWNAKVLEI